MMKKVFSKKVFSLFLSLVIALSLCTGVSITAEASGGDLGYYIYPDGLEGISDEGFAAIAVYTNPSSPTAYTIPSSLGDYPVKAIFTWAFANCTNLTSVTIPDSVVYMEDYVFANCTSLKSVTLSKNIDTIDLCTFVNCISLTDITIPDSVTTIWTAAFNGCNSLTDITLPESVAVIGLSAFENCDNLKSITIKNASCDINDSEYTFPVGTVIYGHSSSTARDYAEKYGRKFICLSHSYKTTVTKAGKKTDGKIVKKCSVCGESKTSTIYHVQVSSYKMSWNSKTYTGKTIATPTITLTDYKGNTISSSNYTVKIVDLATGKTVSKIKNAGKYSIQCILKGNYTGTLKKTVVVKPKMASLSSVSSTAAKTITTKWKTASGVDGYQIEYSTSSKFTDSTTKTVTVKGQSKKSKTVKSNVFKSGTKYYVRIRTYKKVQVNGHSCNIYSSYSDVKTVTVKK